MYVITYSLRENELSSDRYYNEVKIFTYEVILKGKELFSSIIADYYNYRISNSEKKDLSEDLSIEESILELLILGILWRIYSSDALVLDGIPKYMLNKVNQLRKIDDKLKPGADFLKGILSTIFLSPDLYDNMSSIDIKSENLKKLFDWLQATGEFTPEVKRLRKWEEYFSTLTDIELKDIIASTITLALWFEYRSEDTLGKYTSNVDRYLNEIRPKKYWHEDIIFCGRRRVEYHLNMVGAEIMNKIFRKKYLNTAKKVLLLPTCMRIHKDSKCQAEFSGKILKCRKCSKDCNVKKLDDLGDENDFEVLIIPHESSISANNERQGFFDRDTGVVGVACALNLIAGGWSLKEMGIPAQCVLLDYCGCKNHWHNEGIPTEINVGKLKKTIL